MMKSIVQINLQSNDNSRTILERRFQRLMNKESILWLKYPFYLYMLNCFYGRFRDKSNTLHLYCDFVVVVFSSSAPSSFVDDPNDCKFEQK